MRRGESVWCAGIVDFLRALDQSGRFFGRVLHGDDLVVFAVQDQSRNIDLLEILGEVGLGECLDGLIGVLETGLHAPEPELIQDALGDFSAGPVGAVELDRQVLVELRAILLRPAPQIIEHLHRQTFWIRDGLQHDGRDSSERPLWRPASSRGARCSARLRLLRWSGPPAASFRSSVSMTAARSSA